MRAADHEYVIIGGTTKAGTTSLFKYCAAHPDVFAASFKETRFFLDKGYPLDAPYRYSDGLDAYDKLFPAGSGGGVRMEATPDYLHSPGTAARIGKGLPRARLVFILRDPVSRLVSWFSFARQNGILSAGLTFDDYVDQQMTLEGQPGRPQHLRTLEQGRYVSDLRPFYEELGPERILICQFEELVRDPACLMRRLCSFASLDETVYDEFRFQVHNATVEMRSPAIHGRYVRIARRLRNISHRSPMGQAAFRSMHRVVKPAYRRANVRGRPTVGISSATHSRLDEYYRSSQEELKALLS